MRSKFVVKTNTRLRDVIEVTQAETGEVSHPFAFERSNPGFSECVLVRRKKRCSNAPDAGFEDRPIEREREFGVAVAPRKPRVQLLLLEPHEEVSALLLVRKREDANLLVRCS